MGFQLLSRHPTSFWHRFVGGMFPTPSNYRTRFTMTLKEWLLAHEMEVTLRETHWMGVRMLKNPLDSWIYQELIWRIQPEIILEIGSYIGGSTLYFANLLDLLGKGIVISVDIDRSQFKVEHPRICTITGDSGSPDVERHVFELSLGKKVMISHDGAHGKEKVLDDLRRYSPLVSVGSYFVVEDGVFDLFSPFEGLGGFADGPFDAINEFLKENSCFVPDLECERHVFTNNPMGFLKRTR
jgi:cephalosporin hydroxylase